MIKVVLVFFIIIFTYLNVFISNSNFLDKDLFEKINILQILTPILNILLTFLLAYLINIKLSNKNKSYEILINLLEKYENVLDKIHTITMRYIANKEKNDANDIKWLLKQMSIKLSNLEELYKLYDISFIYKIENMEKELLELKQSITNDPFMQHSEYTPAQKTNIIQNFEKIKTNINKEKINLYK